MNKFYSLVLASLLTSGVCSAAAKSPAHKAISKDDAKTNVISSRHIKSVSPARVMKKAAGFSIDEVAGTYDWSYEWLLQTSNPPKSLQVELTDESTGEVSIKGMVPGEDLAVKGYYDLEASTLTIPNNQNLGKDSFGLDNYFYLKDFDRNTGVIYEGMADIEATVGEISGNRVVFPEYDIWVIGDYEDEDAGFWVMTFANTFTLPIVEDEVQEGKWKTIGTCTLEDAWITPSFTDNSGKALNPADFLIHAELQQSVDNESLYRVWRPYHDEAWPISGMNISDYNGQIVFDISDPDHVIVFSGYYAGFDDDYYGNFCVFGLLGWQLGGFDGDYTQGDIENLIWYMEQEDMPFDTYKDGVVTVNASVFDFNISCTNAYSWADTGYTVSKITFPEDPGAVDAISTENAPIRYYNLQGVEIGAPQPGQTVIRRQGSKTTKILTPR